MNNIIGMRKIIWIKILDKSIKEYMYQQRMFWEPLAYENKFYIMTFDNNVYEVMYD